MADAPMKDAEWRYGYGWSERELEERFEQARRAPLNFPLEGPESQAGENWRRYYSESIIAREKKGPPEDSGAFHLAWKAITEYQFSDPGIVTGHFKPKEPLRGRTMLLEIKVFGLRYLCPVRIGAVRETVSDTQTLYAFRYDTVEGHFEVGSEWFFLKKKHDTGEIFFRISASWRPGHFPNWWSRVGFELVGRRYQLAWHRLAYIRLRKLVGDHGRDLVPIPHGEKLVHTGAEIQHSNIWILNEPSPAERVRQAGKPHKEGDAECPQSERETLSSSPGPLPVSADPRLLSSPKNVRG